MAEFDSARYRISRKFRSAIIFPDSPPAVRCRTPPIGQPSPQRLPAPSRKSSEIRRSRYRCRQASSRETDSPTFSGRGRGAPCPYQDIVEFGLRLVSKRTIRVIGIFRPTSWIRRDIFANAIQLLFVANHVFDIMALPEQCPTSTANFIDSFRAGRFECADTSLTHSPKLFSSIFPSMISPNKQLRCHVQTVKK